MKRIPNCHLSITTHMWFLCECMVRVLRMRSTPSLFSLLFLPPQLAFNISLHIYSRNGIYTADSPLRSPVRSSPSSAAEPPACSGSV
jgi:hypothetical protein